MWIVQLSSSHLTDTDGWDHQLKIISDSYYGNSVSGFLNHLPGHNVRNEWSDIRRGTRVRCGLRCSPAKIGCWEAARTVRIRGKFTAQRMAKLPAVGFLEPPPAGSSQGIREPGPDHKGGAGLTLSCLQPRLSRWKVTGRVLTVLRGETECRGITGPSLMRQECNKHALFSLKSLAERGSPQGWPKAAVFQLKIGVSNSTMSNLFLLIGAPRSIQTDLLLFAQTRRLVYQLRRWFTSSQCSRIITEWKNIFFT